MEYNSKKGEHCSNGRYDVRGFSSILSFLILNNPSVLVLLSLQVYKVPLFSFASDKVSSKCHLTSFTRKSQTIIALAELLHIISTYCRIKTAFRLNNWELYTNKLIFGSYYSAHTGKHIRRSSGLRFSAVRKTTDPFSNAMSSHSVCFWTLLTRESSKKSEVKFLASCTVRRNPWTGQTRYNTQHSIVPRQNNVV